MIDLMIGLKSFFTLKYLPLDLRSFQTLDSEYMQVTQVKPA